MILLFLLFSLLGPMFTTYSYSDQNLAMVNIPPLMKVYDVGSCRVYISPSLKLIQVDGEGNLSGVLSPIRTENEKSMMIFDCGGKEVALYYGSSSYVVCDEATGNIYPSGYHWCRDHVLGTDALGRDILARLMYGTRVSLCRPRNVTSSDSTTLVLTFMISVAMPLLRSSTR